MYEGYIRVSNMFHLLLSDAYTEVYFKLYELLHVDNTVTFKCSASHCKS